MSSLFDGLDEPDAWQEVPQARYLSWTKAEQLTYCAARDEDSARIAVTDDERTFFLDRAAAYIAEAQSCQR